MSPKKLIQTITNHNLGLQERLFRLLVTIGLLGLAFGILIGLLLGETLANTCSLLAVFIVALLITYFTIHYQKIQVGAVLIAILIIYFALPFNFLTCGGIYGGGPIWLMFGAFFACLVVEKKAKYVLILSSFFVYGACYLYTYFNPETVAVHSTKAAYVDSFFTLVIVTIVVCSMILFQNAIYRRENRIAKEQKKEIEDLNQMQNHFFSSMSHEIRTPINTIIGLNEMILREEVSDEVASDAKSIQGASKMLLSLINDILDMSKIESGKMKIVPAVYETGNMLSDVVNMIWIRAKEKGLEFHINVDPLMPSQLLGDEVRIQQILINVLNNAVKYTQEGSVTLSIQCKKQERGKALISYSVTDTGMGIKKESIPYLFRAFKRFDEKENRYIEGTGLGLSIVKQLVDLMEGDISVNSVYTKGSTFVISIPQEIVSEEKIGELDLERHHDSHGREHYRQSFEAEKAKILIVDDNETNLMVAEKLLRDTKVRIDTATSGAECLKKSLQSHYDVIFMDHLMPEMDGVECLHAIRSQVGGLNHDTKIVVLTANAGSDNRSFYYREGFDGYLLKPVSGTQLEEELLRHLPKNLVRKMGHESQAGLLEAPVLEHRKKMPVMISTDSTSDLPHFLVEKNSIAMMPYKVVTEGGEFLDGVETETEGILDYMRRSGNKVQSEPPKVSDYEAFFAEQLSRAQTIIHISMADKVSDGFAHAVEASKAFDNVIVMNSGHLSSGMGLVVLRAASYAAGGMGADEIVAKVEEYKKQIQTSFIVSDTVYLMQAGRISQQIHKLCQAFMMHPVIRLKNSKMKVKTVHIGRRKSAWKNYIRSTLSGKRKIDKKVLFITYAGLTNEELQEITADVRKEVLFESVFYQKASPAVSINCGPGTFGLLFAQVDTETNENERYEVRLK